MGRFIYCLPSGERMESSNCDFQSYRWGGERHQVKPLGEGRKPPPPPHNKMRNLGVIPAQHHLVGGGRRPQNVPAYQKKVEAWISPGKGTGDKRKTSVLSGLVRLRQKELGACKRTKARTRKSKILGTL